MRLFHFAGAEQAEDLALTGRFDAFGTTFELRLTKNGLRGIELSNCTRTDAFTSVTCWLVVIELDEEVIEPYRTRMGRLTRSIAWRSSSRAEWIVPASVVERHARVVSIGDFSESDFAKRWRTRD